MPGGMPSTLQRVGWNPPLPSHHCDGSVAGDSHTCVGLHRYPDTRAFADALPLSRRCACV
eukprot:366569-Chlamydomonas_euryale.AAC.39